MKHEVSVTELLEREGWGERVPPPPRSRWRVVAVMLAVVIGCGTAAVLVAFNGPRHDNAKKDDQIGVIDMPHRTSGAGGADESNTPETTEGGTGGGTVDTTSASSRTSTSGTTSSGTTTWTGATTPWPTTAGTTPRDDPPPRTTGSTTPPPTPPHTTTPTTRTSEPCPILWPFC
ncbi:hypothetical protein ACFWY9_31630 [Amycolatopsis sp. NPDC059027]|uniref:hypothetical protein n=1 Tax=unclassified Amycolatopsis TaxID=2618356 RepID=UPI00367003EB